MVIKKALFYLVPLIAGSALGFAFHTFGIEFWGCVSLSFGLAGTILMLTKLQLARLDGVVADIGGLVIEAEANAHSLHGLISRFPGIHMPVSGWSMRASNIEGLVSQCDLVRPSMVVEVGSGVSTLFLAAWLKAQGDGGRLISFDHDAGWARLCNENLRRLGLDGVAEVRVAPLREQQGEAAWYDLRGVAQDVRAVDLLVVDGPPAGKGPLSMARFPAVGAFYPRMSPTATIFLDDGAREGERRVVEAWVKAYPEFQASEYRTLSGYWVLHRDGRGGAGSGSADEAGAVAPRGCSAAGAPAAR